MHDDFWRRWKSEYLSTLQTRTHWWNLHEDLPLGLLVLIKDENTPAAEWPPVKVAGVIPRPDGHVRAASVKTASGVYDRPIHKLCLLPVPTSDD